MAKQIINIGRTANDRSGDPLRSAFNKVNENFTELYNAVGADVQIPSQTNNGGKVLTTNGVTLSWTDAQPGNPFNQSLNTDDTVNFDGISTALVNYGQYPLSAPVVGGFTDKLRLYDFNSISTTNYAIGVEPNHMWFGVDVATAQAGFKFYGSETEILSITGDGKIHLAAGGDIVDSNGQSVIVGSSDSYEIVVAGGTNGAETALDLTKRTHVLRDGWYSLAAGTEGQVMHFVPHSSVTNMSAINIRVNNGRYNDGAAVTDFADNFITVFWSQNGTAMATAIYADGAWSFNKGMWD